MAPQKIYQYSIQMEQDEEETIVIIQHFIECVKQQQLHTSLLPFQARLFDPLRQKVQDQQIKLKQFLKHEDEEIRLSQKNFRYMIYKAQCQKLQYLLKMYLKIRLKKIQLYCFFFMKNHPEAQALMSSSQMKFLRKYSEVRFEYYKDNVFKYLSKPFKDFKEVEMIFAKNEQQSREKKLLVQTNQSIVELKAPKGNDYVFAEILFNQDHARYGIDIEVANVPSDFQDVISQGTIIYSQLKNIQEKFPQANYRLI